MKKYLIIGLIIVIVVLVILAVLIATGSLKNPLAKLNLGQFGLGQKGTVIEENLVIPQTESIAENQGRIAAPTTTAYEVPLVPKDNSEKIIVPDAGYTLKASYEAAKNPAETWSADVRLVLIKSLGT